MLDLDGIPDYADGVRRQVAAYVAGHPFSADQTRFLRTAQSVFLQKRTLSLADLYEPPLTSFGHDAVDWLFTPEEVNDVLEFIETLSISPLSPPRFEFALTYITFFSII